jgi:hypothetical protein
MVTNLGGRVEQWLQELRYTVTSVSDNNAAWHFIVNHPRNTTNKMHILGPKGFDDTVITATAATVSPQHLEGYDRLDDEERTKFLFALKRTLNALPVEFRLVGENGAPAPDECPRAFEVSAVRFADGLTKDEFYETIGNVYKTWLSAVMVVQEELGGGDVGPAGRFDFKKLGL